MATRRKVVRPPTQRSQRVARSATPTGLWWCAALIVLVGVLAYGNSLSGPFIFDDQLSIVENPHIRELWRLSSVLVPDRESPVAGRPVVNVAFAINYAIGGLDVRGYHVGNLAIHLCCALLVFGIVRRTLESLDPDAGLRRRSVTFAFATALIWTLHPLNSEVVDYLTQRTESLMALFYLSTLYASVRAVGSRREIAWQAVAVLACALGMACKESMVTAPLLVVLYDRVFVFGSAKAALKARWRFYAALATTWLVLAALLWSGPRVHSAGFSTGVHPWTYLLNQAVMIVQYLRLAVWPRSLVVIYGWPFPPLTLGDVMPYALAVLLLLLLTVVTLVRRPKLGFLGAWFFITLAPTSSIVPIATEVGAERRMYLPLVALVTLAVIGCGVLQDVVTRKWPDRAAKVNPRTASLGAAFALVVVSVALAVGTITRNREYESSLSLARTVLERRPTSLAHHVIGTELMTAGYHEEAVMHLRAAIGGTPKARYNLGVELFNEKKLNEAIEQLQEFARLEPLLLEVVTARTIMGRAFALQEKWPQAIEQFRQVLTMRPSNVEAQGLLADSLFAQQAFDEAIVQYRKYLEFRPTNVGALGNLGIALDATGKIDEALAAFRRAVETNPQDAGARHNLANALLGQRDFQGAELHAREALRLAPRNPVAHNILGLALAAQDHADEAIDHFRQALAMDPQDPETRDHLETAMRRRNSTRGGRR